MVRMLTAGESHGKALVAVLEGLPAGVPVDPDALAHQLARRRHGYGRVDASGSSPTGSRSSPACATDEPWVRRSP